MKKATDEAHSSREVVVSSEKALSAVVAILLSFEGEHNSVDRVLIRQSVL
jgi:hypothetical protein